MALFEVKTYSVRGESVLVDAELHATLNELAGQFYECHGYLALPAHDYAASTHPQERLMYKMALTAHLFQLNVGLE